MTATAEASRLVTSPDFGVATRIRAGIAAGALLFGAFGAWSATAPIESAAIAPGTVVVESTRKTLQHLEGGVVRDILVSDGTKVKAGDVLIRLDATRARANNHTLADQLAAALAEEARLSAELAGRDTFAVPPELAARRDEPGIANLLAGQERILHLHREVLQARIAVWAERVAQSRAEIEGFRAQDAALARQIQLIDEETADARVLMAKGLDRRPHLLALERSRADLEGRRADALAQGARSRQAIAEGAAEMASLQYDATKEVAEQLRDARAKTKELRDQLQVAADVLARTEIRAPVDGMVTGLKVHTVGGVIAPGDTILDIVPMRDRLVIDVAIRPEDIHLVHRGQPAQIRLPAYRQRIAPSLSGTLDYVAPDRLSDKPSEAPHYEGRVVIDETDLKAHPEIRLVPGMQAEAMILTGHSTVALYALSPFIDVFRHALRDR
jgi:HlyD family secretion protein